MKIKICLFISMVMISLCLTACSSEPEGLFNISMEDEQTGKTPEDGYLHCVEDEPDTVDFQHTTIHYTVAQNVFDRLVEQDDYMDFGPLLLPSLAWKWEISDDRCSYTFDLVKDVTFSNGSRLTAGDVLYTFKRLLTDPESFNTDIVEQIVGAELLREGKTEELEGFTIHDDYRFTITLNEPNESFLSSLSMPGASILDEETTEEAGARFGLDPEWTIGTGPFILESWTKGEGMVFRANKDCWAGPPACDGLYLTFDIDPEAIRTKFSNGELDILNLDDIGKGGEYYLHGDAYEDRVYEVPWVSMTYIALNEAIQPLDDVRVRKALQYALNRQMLLDAAYNGHGSIEQGIIPYGLYGYNPKLDEIPYDINEAERLLAEAGFPDGFELTFSVSSSSSPGVMNLVRMITPMWEEIGVRVRVDVLDEKDFLSRRRSGELACYTATWSADYDDPDNFFYTFFGNTHNTTFRSLGYSRKEIMQRVNSARQIANPGDRIREYQELERIIVQEDAAWIPLFSKTYYYVASERLDTLRYSWNGSVKNKYREMSVKKDDDI